jgi:hypothetical protein
MRNWIIGAAAILAVAAPGVAAAQSGYVGVIYSNVEMDGVDDSDAWGGEGAVAFAGSGSISFEVDAAIVDSDEGGTSSGITGHVYHRTDSHLFGGFIGVANADVSGGDDSTTWYGGLEANKYFANWTLAGALAYGNNDDAEADGWGVNVEARAFVNDNLRLQGNVGWATIDSDTAGDDDALVFGVGGEWQADAMPISVALGYAHSELDEADIEADTVSVAVRWNFGGGTLRDRDRSGASQAGIASFVGGIVL